MNITIAYFSGTGGTAMAAASLAEALARRGQCAKLHEITAGAEISGGEDYLALLFAVHAFNAPLPVYRWINALKSADGTPAAVIAVSGGGEIFPNTAMRQSCIRKLKKKGYDVGYEDGIVMPSNIFAATPKPGAARLLRALPEKAGLIADAITARQAKRLRPHFIDRLISRLGEFEKLFARLFGKCISSGDACNGCGVCAKRCPMGNISLKNGKPFFKKNCCMCLRCVYGCPEKALNMKFFKSMILKDYDLNALKYMEYGPEEAALKGKAWKGARSYLEEVETAQRE